MTGGAPWADLPRPLDEAGLNAVLQRIPYAVFQGYRARLDGGAFSLAMPFRRHLVGNVMLPALHGGVLGALMETAALMQLMIETASEHLPRPIDIAIDYLRSGQAKDTFARALIVKHGRRVANVRVEAWQDDPAKPIAALHGHFLVEAPKGT